MKMMLECERRVFIAVQWPHEDLSKPKNEEERDNFWDCVNDLRADENVILLGDLNARAGNEEIDGIIGKLGLTWVIDWNV